MAKIGELIEEKARARENHLFVYLRDVLPEEEKVLAFSPIGTKLSIIEKEPFRDTLLRRRVVRLLQERGFAVDVYRDKLTYKTSNIEIEGYVEQEFYPTTLLVINW